MSATKSKVLNLYRCLLRESKKFNTYNFREYALEKIKHDFHANKSATDSALIDQLIKSAEENLEIIKRQVLVGQMYGEGHLVIENPSLKKS